MDSSIGRKRMRGSRNKCNCKERRGDMWKPPSSSTVKHGQDGLTFKHTKLKILTHVLTTRKNCGTWKLRAMKCFVSPNVLFRKCAKQRSGNNAPFKDTAMRRKSACSLKVTWMLDWRECGPWHEGGEKIDISQQTLFQKQEKALARVLTSKMSAHCLHATWKRHSNWVTIETWKGLIVEMIVPQSQISWTVMKWSLKRAPWCSSETVMSTVGP